MALDFTVADIDDIRCMSRMGECIDRRIFNLMPLQMLPIQRTVQRLRRF
jgi:hypothetical protein